jgi:hypothetical protein
MRRVGSVLVLTFLLLFTVFSVWDVALVRGADTIYIQADGFVAGSSKIVSGDNVTYTFTDNINGSIIVERNNIVIDGAGGMDEYGITLSGTTGFCNITVPAKLMSGDFTLYLDDVALVEGVDYTESYNGTHYLFSVTYVHSSHVIDLVSTEVMPDFAAWLFLPFVMSATLLGFALRKRMKKQRKIV